MEIFESGSLVAVISLVLFFVGYRYYSKFLAEKIYRLDPDYITPAHRFKDGVDYVPANKYVLWGHHFTSIAGAAPIVGPAIAVYWGWVPAMLWVVFGTIFAAGVHDFGVMVISVRNKGQSIGTLADKMIGQRAKILFLFIILILVLMINAVFAWVISNLFISFPASVLSIFIQIPLAIWIGYRTYRGTGSIMVPALIVLLVMYFTAILASYVPVLQIDLVQYFGGEENVVILGMSGIEMSFFYMDSHPHDLCLHRIHSAGMETSSAERSYQLLPTAVGFTDSLPWIIRNKPRYFCTTHKHGSRRCELVSTSVYHHSLRGNFRIPWVSFLGNHCKTA